MGTPLRIKRSAVPGKVPVVQDLQLGELALNTYDAELYTLRYRPGIGTEVVKIGGASVQNILYVKNKQVRLAIVTGMELDLGLGANSLGDYFFI